MYNKIIIAFILTICLNSTMNIADTESGAITSDWVMDNAETFTSAQELILYPQQLAKLQQEQAAQEAQLQAEIATMKSKRAKLIECLNEKGISLYTSENANCKTCKQQAAILGDDLKNLKNYTNCDKESIVCALRNISEYPTWYMGFRSGIKKSGVRELAALARIAECEY